MLPVIKLEKNKYTTYYLQLNDNNLQNLFPTNTTWKRTCQLWKYKLYTNFMKKPPSLTRSDQLLSSGKVMPGHILRYMYYYMAAIWRNDWLYNAWKSRVYHSVSGTFIGHMGKTPLRQINCSYNFVKLTPIGFFLSCPLSSCSLFLL